MKRIRIHATHAEAPVMGGEYVQEERYPAFLILYDQTELDGEVTVGHLALEDRAAQLVKAGVDLLNDVVPALGVDLVSVEWTGWTPPEIAGLPEIVGKLKTVLRMLGIKKGD